MTFVASFLNRLLSRDFIWEASAGLLAVYLLFHPALAHPLSTATALGGGLFLFLWRPIRPESLSGPGPFWFLFLLYSFLNSIGSLSPGLSWQSAAFLFLGTVLFLMASDSSTESKARWEGFGFFLALAAAGLGLYQTCFGFERWAAQSPQLSGLDLTALYDAEKSRRAFGPLVTSGSLAALMALFIPWGFIQWKIQRGGKKIFFLGATLVLTAGLLATKSVGACVALAVGVSLVLVYRRAWAWLGAAGMAGVGAIGWVLIERGWTHWQAGAFSTRISLWRSAWDIFKNHPLFGYGIGTFDLAYQQSGFPLNQGARFAHDLPLQVLVEGGLAGFGLFAAALVSILRRLKAPPRWEGWGVMTGVLAFSIFSLFDLPFQMPELVWIFALLLGRLELKPAKHSRLPEIPEAWVEVGLMAVLLVAGFWPPFRPWNWALLAGAFWMVAASRGRVIEKQPLWIAAGGAFLILRAFHSPSALGTVRFMETAGLALVFSLVLGSLKNPGRFLKGFLGLGLVWALGLWIDSFRASDMKDWGIFPNPKQVGTFLLPLLFLSVEGSWRTRNLLETLRNPGPRLKPIGLFLFSAATFYLLKPFGAVIGFVAGGVVSIPAKYRRWAVIGGLLLAGVFLLLRADSFSGPRAGATQWDRLSIWKSAARVWAQSPWIGAGPGAFAGDYHRVEPPRTTGVSRYQMDAEFAHNEALGWLTAFGLAGLVFAVFALRRLWPSDSPGGMKKRASLTAVGTASLFDFCLHTPMILLAGAGLLTPPSKRKNLFSWPAGFLALGLTLGLFGAAAWVPGLLGQARALAVAGRYPESLQCLDTAVRLDAWDARVQAVRADFLESLYLNTGDNVWKSRSDEAFASVMGLEQADGRWAEQKADRLSRRFEKNPSPLSASLAQAAWADARLAAPLNAFVFFKEGLFRETESRWAKKTDPSLLKSLAEGALSDFQKAASLEPNYASAWVDLGYCQKRDPAIRPLARESFRKALAVYDQWKGIERIAPLEKQMVALPPSVIPDLRKEVAAP